MTAIMPKGWKERNDRSQCESEDVDVAIPVSAFLRSGDLVDATVTEIDRAFSAARGPRGKKAACFDLKRLFPSALKRRIKCSAKFVDFDSGNITHAGALYKVTLRGTVAAIAKVDKYLHEAGY